MGKQGVEPQRQAIISRFEDYLASWIDQHSLSRKSLEMTLMESSLIKVAEAEEGNDIDPTLVVAAAGVATDLSVLMLAMTITGPMNKKDGEKVFDDTKQKALDKATAWLGCRSEISPEKLRSLIEQLVEKHFLQPEAQTV